MWPRVNSWLGITCGLRLLVLYSALRGVFCVLRFSYFLKNQRTVHVLIVDFCWQKQCLSNGKWPSFTL